MSASVIVVGSFNLDHVWTTARLPEPGATRSGSYASGPGGKGFNQAIAAARAGAATCFIAALGTDAAAAIAHDLAAKNGLELAIEPFPAEPSGTAAVLVDATGRNLIVVALGANLHLTPGFATGAITSQPDARVLLAQLESPPATIHQALGHARAHGLFTVLNPAPADARVDAAMLQACELITPNESEFSALMHRFDGLEVAPEAVAGLDDEALVAACSVLPCPRVLVTLGAGGCVLVASGRVTRFAAETVDCVDSTGAGDAFNGALCARLAEGTPLHEAIVFAGRYAGLSTEQHGAALSMPAGADVARRFG